MSTITKPTPAALRAAEAVYEDAANYYKGYDYYKAALAIDRETGLQGLVEALESMRCTVCEELIGTNFPSDWCLECKAARAALAKARG